MSLNERLNKFLIEDKGIENIFKKRREKKRKREKEREKGDSDEWR